MIIHYKLLCNIRVKVGTNSKLQNAKERGMKVRGKQKKDVYS